MYTYTYKSRPVGSKRVASQATKNMIRVYGDTGTEVNEMEGRENRGEKEAMEVKEHHAGHVSVCPMPVERDDYRFLALARSSQNLGHRFVNELTVLI